MWKRVLIILLFTAGLSAYSAVVPACQVYPSQCRYSSQNVKLKVEKIRRKGGFTDVLVVKAPFGYVLVDGHHHVLAALELGHEEIPIQVLADLSYHDEEGFWREAHERGWAYLEGEDRPTFSTMYDDPNRYFAVLTARRYDEIENEWFGAEYPVWYKLGKDIPFIELRIADALRERGIVYAYDMGEHPSPAFIEQARQALIEANIEGLRVVPNRMHYEEYEAICRDIHYPDLSDHPDLKLSMQ